jgi:pimeloyl-ACP methyl ester carboxylesterase
MLRVITPIAALPRAIRLGIAAFGVAFALLGAARVEGAPQVDPVESLAPHLLLIHGGSFLFEDPTFEAVTRQAALDAGFIPHYLRYPLGDLGGAVRAARAEARRLGALYPGRLYAYGSSAGGTLAALLAGDGMVRAALAKAPPSDLVGWEWPLTTYGTDYFERIGADAATRQRLSPLRRPARRPLLLLHGRNDAVVPVAMSEAFAAKFPRVELWVVGGGHHAERRRPQILARGLALLAGIDDRESTPRPRD